MLFDAGAQVRQLTIAARGDAREAVGEPVPGVDRDRLQPVDHAERGSFAPRSLDERLVRRVYLTDAGVIAYRHYELWTDTHARFSHCTGAARVDRQRDADHPQGAGRRPRSASTSTAAAATTTSATRLLAQAGGAFVLAASWSTRLLASYDMAHETATGLPGNLQIGWLTLHAESKPKSKLKKTRAIALEAGVGVAATLGLAALCGVPQSRTGAARSAPGMAGRAGDRRALRDARARHRAHRRLGRRWPSPTAPTGPSRVLDTLAMPIELGALAGVRAGRLDRLRERASRAGAREQGRRARTARVRRRLDHRRAAPRRRWRCARATIASICR